jgi:hypothetical protein
MLLKANWVGFVYVTFRPKDGSRSKYTYFILFLKSVASHVQNIRICVGGGVRLILAWQSERLFLTYIQMCSVMSTLLGSSVIDIRKMSNFLD